MNYALEQIGVVTTWLSLLFIAGSVFGSICALGAAGAVRWFARQPACAPPTLWPDVSILKPLYGAEAQLSENVETYFNQDYPG
jgi:ceramide glucosyltransferase